MIYELFKNTKLYRNPQVLTILALGFSSGLPFLLTLATLQVWLKEIGITKTIIGLFSFVTIPYTLKFFWAPIIDSIPFPLLSRYLGQRKGWLLGSQVSLILSLLFLGSTDPKTSLATTALAAFLVTFSSATQDIVFEAYRVEAIPPNLQGPASGASSFGYRLGIWASGAGALFIASSYSWFTVYAVMASLVSIGIISVLLSPNFQNEKIEPRKVNDISDFIKDSFSDFLKHDGVVLIFFFILFYKVGDTVLNTMTMPFLVEINFTKIEIAKVANTFGIITVIIGGLVGGLLLSIRPLNQILISVSILQIIASGIFMIQAHLGHNLQFLYLTLGFENFTTGLGISSFIFYLSNRCYPPFTGTHYALLTSFASMCRILLSSIAGWTSDQLSWMYFYGLTAVFCLPCLFLLFLKREHFIVKKT